MAVAMKASAELGRAPVCYALGIARASFYRALCCRFPKGKRRAFNSPRALSNAERQYVLDVLHDARFFDKAPLEIYATLLDEGKYLCSVSTMYRILAENQEIRERRNQLRHPNYQKPELLATGPNQVWSWDITKLRGPAKWTCYHLYVILDIFSRYVVGWMVAHREDARLAERLIDDTCAKEGIERGELTVHADRGSSMTSKAVAMLLGDLGVTKSHSRPQTSNDNPFSESQFKTLKYRPNFPDRFSSIFEARPFCRKFFTWYNEEHRHGGIALLAPAMVHDGIAGEVIRKRQEILDGAFAAHPERFIRRAPKAPQLPEVAGINLPRPQTVDEKENSTLNSEQKVSQIA